MSRNTNSTKSHSKRVHSSYSVAPPSPASASQAAPISTEPDDVNDMRLLDDMDDVSTPLSYEPDWLMKKHKHKYSSDESLASATSSDSRLRVLVYTAYFYPIIDGQSHQLHNFCHRLVRRGDCDLTLVVARDKVDSSKIDGPHTRVVKWPSFIIPGYAGEERNANFWNIPAIVQLLRDSRPDVIFSAGPDFITASFSLVGRFMGIPVVSSYHTDAIGFAQDSMPGWISPLVYAALPILWLKHFADAQIAMTPTFSSTMRRTLLPVDGVWPMQVCRSTFYPTSKPDQKLRDKLTFGIPNARLAVTVTRLVPEKISTSFVLQVIERARQLCPDKPLVVAVIGDGPERDLWSPLHGQQAGIYAEPRIWTHEELRVAYQAADVCLSTCACETFGCTVLESIASGTPAVVPNQNGTLATVTRTGCGVLYEAYSPDSCATVLTGLLNDQKHMAFLQAKSRSLSASISFENSADKLVEHLLKPMTSQPVARKIVMPLMYLVSLLCAVLVHIARHDAPYELSESSSFFAPLLHHEYATSFIVLLFCSGLWFWFGTLRRSAVYQGAILMSFMFLASQSSAATSGSISPSLATLSVGIISGPTAVFALVWCVACWYVRTVDERMRSGLPYLQT
jgi:glycosyltransferase involved in cell wall biosynthesis